MSEWVNEWMSEWVNEWMSEWVNEWREILDGYQVLRLTVNFLQNMEFHPCTWSGGASPVSCRGGGCCDEAWEEGRGGGTCPLAPLSNGYVILLTKGEIKPKLLNCHKILD